MSTELIEGISSLILIAALIAIPFILLLGLRWITGFSKKRRMFCTTCGHEGEVRKELRGNFLIELLLWLFFLAPGLVYSVWRFASRRHRCPLCEAENMIPASSPEAIERLKGRPAS